MPESIFNLIKDELYYVTDEKKKMFEDNASKNDILDFIGYLKEDLLSFAIGVSLFRFVYKQRAEAMANECASDFVNSFIFNWSNNKFAMQIYNRRYSCKYDDRTQTAGGELGLCAGELIVYHENFIAWCKNQFIVNL